MIEYIFNFLGNCIFSVSGSCLLFAGVFLIGWPLNWAAERYTAWKQAIGAEAVRRYLLEKEWSND